MRKSTGKSVRMRAAAFALGMTLFMLPGAAAQDGQTATTVMGVRQINPTTVELSLSEGRRMTLDFYGDNIFRLFRDDAGGIVRNPGANPEARILVGNPRKEVSKLEIADKNGFVSITTDRLQVSIDKSTSLLRVTDNTDNSVAFEQAEPVRYGNGRIYMTLKAAPDEYFYGGGVQNGRFSHKGKVIAIENQNSWTDGGVASPTPFYWSTKGYGVMWHTFKKGWYDFGATDSGLTILSHETDYLDIFFMVGGGAVPLLNDFYQLTGNPVLIPKFGFYQGHLNAYNRDYWIEDEKGILFEDGKRYKESQKDNGGIKESLNDGEGNYQFTARAVIDRYRYHDMPLGWILPNDGYGAGYGQEETLDGNIENLRKFGEYARKNGVEIGLWTQSALHPNTKVEALLQRDIVKEVRDAGVRVLKTDVAWVGPGYSFGLNGVADAARIMTYYGNDSRPFIISLDGWAGTQRYAGIWTGDQTGGQWEYIRFHIPTYLGSGLSGQPNICSDMDGIFGGKNMAVNTRDFQWKTFTPMQLNMDGWGSNEKYPHALGEPATSINRWYLKLKSELMPYAYSVAEESVDGLPMVRAMFLEYPNPYTMGKATQYQFLYGPCFLVAPIYQATRADEKGNDIRDGIYLPEGQWVDYFTGDLWQGGRIVNSFDSPLWKLPVFVKNGAIIPMANPNNNVTQINNGLRIYELYPYGYSSFTEYDDDGVTEQYRYGRGVRTLIESNAGKDKATITINPAQGGFDGFVKNKATELRINVTQKPKKVSAKIGKGSVKLTEARSMDEFGSSYNVYFYNAAPNLNNFATPGSDFEKLVITKNPQLLIRLASADITAAATTVAIDGFAFAPADRQRVTQGPLTAPIAQITEENTQAYTLRPTWTGVANADYYEIRLGDMLYSTIRDTTLLFDGLGTETSYTFAIRAVNKDGYSEWAEFGAMTKSNPLEFAVRGIRATTTAENQRGQGIDRLFDFDEGNLWHTRWSTQAVPFDITMDLTTINRLDKMHYLPRTDRGNGILLRGAVFHSMDREEWTLADSIDWADDNEVKVFEFEGNPTARYIKIAITEAVGGFGSGRELYVFRVPGSDSYLPGDINNDGKIDRNDLTSFINYMGLRKTDADFEYVSMGDLNRNGLIDAYDISVVATQLDEGISRRPGDTVTGRLQISTARQIFSQGEIIEVMVKGVDLHAVNALSFALPYDPQYYEFVGIQTLNTRQMENFTNDRLHSDGTKALYPTFVNIGTRDTIEGSEELFVIKFRARRNLKFDLRIIDGILVDRNLNTVKF